MQVKMSTYALILTGFNIFLTYTGLGDVGYDTIYIVTSIYFSATLILIQMEKKCQ